MDSLLSPDWRNLFFDVFEGIHRQKPSLFFIMDKKMMKYTAYILMFLFLIILQISCQRDIEVKKIVFDEPLFILTDGENDDSD